MQIVIFSLSAFQLENKWAYQLHDIFATVWVLMLIIQSFLILNKKNALHRKNVVLELMNGNSFLLLPSQNEDKGSGTWTTAQKGTTLKLTCVYNFDGLKVLGVFTDETSLLGWAKKPTQYTALSSKDVLKLCEEQLIERIIVNSDLPTMFVLERNRANFKTETIKEETRCKSGHPTTRWIE